MPKIDQIKTDRKGLTSQEDGLKPEPEDTKEKSKAKFAAMKSSSFWSWHSQGMKGPENTNTRLKLAKKELKQNRGDNIDLSGKHPVSALMELCQRPTQRPTASSQANVQASSASQFGAIQVSVSQADKSRQDIIKGGSYCLWWS